jgi:hypothetical protein
MRGGTGLAVLNPETLMLTMVGLAKEQRRMLIDKLPDAANIALGGLVFGQFLGDRPFSVGVAVLGIVTWAAFLGGAFVLGGESGA